MKFPQRYRRTMLSTKSNGDVVITWVPDGFNVAEVYCWTLVGILGGLMLLAVTVGGEWPFRLMLAYAISMTLTLIPFLWWERRTHAVLIPEEFSSTRLSNCQKTRRIRHLDGSHTIVYRYRWQWKLMSNYWWWGYIVIQGTFFAGAALEPLALWEIRFVLAVAMSYVTVWFGGTLFLVRRFPDAPWEQHP